MEIQDDVGRANKFTERQEKPSNKKQTVESFIIIYFRLKLNRKKQSKSLYFIKRPKNGKMQGLWHVERPLNFLMVIWENILDFLTFFISPFFYFWSFSWWCWKAAQFLDGWPGKKTTRPEFQWGGFGHEVKMAKNLTNKTAS